jgi:ribosome-associated protein
MSKAERDVLITREPVELYKILKFEGLADNGGAAKALIEQGLVSVNGELEMRKRRKIVSGDLIELAGESLRVGLAGPVSQE